MQQSDDLANLLDDWDPRHPELEHPWPAYRALRDTCPVASSTKYGGFRVVSRYEDVSSAASDFETFSSAAGITLPPYGNPRPMIPLELDPPDQSDFRRLLSPRLSARRVAVLEESLREQARSLLAPIIERGHADIVHEFAEVYPILAFWQEPLMGPPVESQLTGGDWLVSFHTWNHDLHHSDERTAEAADKMHGYIDEVLEDRRRTPRDDIPSELLKAEIGGRRLSHEEVRDTLFLFFSAGIETTSAMLGNALHVLGRDAGARRRIAADHSLLPLAVEELLRLVGPSQGVKRTATRDAEIAGCPVGDGEAVLLLWASANRDERQFPAPDELVVDRAPNPHLAFGKGVHRCLGIHFARLEVRVALEEILSAMPDYEIAVPDESLRWKTGVDRVLTSLPVNVTKG